LKKIFITFGDEKFRATRERLRSEAAALNVFDETHAFGPEHLHPDFLAKHHRFMRAAARGYGYWIWKPHLIQKFLERLNDGDLLMYADAGCQFNPTRKARLLEYFDIIKGDPIGILSFRIGDLTNGAFSKMDTVLALHGEKFLSEPMRMGGVIFIRNCETSRKFVSEWLSYCENYQLINDDPSRAANTPDFQDHRHDQSIFSLLCARYGVASLPDETDSNGVIQTVRLGPRAGFFQKIRRSILKRRAQLRW
jgi:hypothetical protein